MLLCHSFNTITENQTYHFLWQFDWWSLYSLLFFILFYLLLNFLFEIFFFKYCNDFVPIDWSSITCLTLFLTHKSSLINEENGEKSPSGYIPRISGTEHRFKKGRGEILYLIQKILTSKKIPNSFLYVDLKKLFVARKMYPPPRCYVPGFSNNNFQKDMYIILPSRRPIWRIRKYFAGLVRVLVLEYFRAWQKHSTSEPASYLSYVNEYKIWRCVSAESKL